jgi:hypothetical protein
MTIATLRPDPLAAYGSSRRCSGDAVHNAMPIRTRFSSPIRAGSSVTSPSYRLDLTADALLPPRGAMRGRRSSAMIWIGSGDRRGPRRQGLPSRVQTRDRRGGGRHRFRISVASHCRADRKDLNPNQLDAAHTAGLIKRRTLRRLALISVPKVGLEPTPSCGDRILSPGLLPYTW